MIFLILFALDKLLKLFLINSGNTIAINDGILFGIYLDPIILSIVLMLVFILIIYYRKFFISNFPLKIIATGIIMNTTDRFIWGGVFDYIYILNILVINLADVIILIGIIYLIYSKYISEKRNFVKS